MVVIKLGATAKLVYLIYPRHYWDVLTWLTLFPKGIPALLRGDSDMNHYYLLVQGPLTANSVSQHFIPQVSLPAAQPNIYFESRCYELSP